MQSERLGKLIPASIRSYSVQFMYSNYTQIHSYMISSLLLINVWVR